MRYILADIDNDTVTIDKITDDPVEYISRIEPIDVVGHKVVWDEEGNLYDISPDKILKDSDTSKRMAIVDVGEWDFEKGEPRLVKVADGQVTKMRKALISYLQSNPSTEGKLRRLFSRKNKIQASNLDYTTLSLDDLIRRAEETL
jgi:hypothetical protein